MTETVVKLSKGERRVIICAIDYALRMGMTLPKLSRGDILKLTDKMRDVPVKG